MGHLLKIRQMCRLTTILLFGLFLQQNIQAQSKPYVVMLSMDGFRWDYMDHAETPTLDSFITQAARVNQLQPSFPTKTFPNHYTIATGLVPDHHGIVLNDFYDPSTDRVFRVSNRKAVEDGSFYSGEPIWCVAERNGIRTGSYFWVGSEAEINGCRPTYWKKYEHRFPYGQRIDSIVSWLDQPYDIRPHLVLWYFDEPDGVGHDFGPLSPECIRKVEELDSFLNVFFNKARQLNQFDSINFLIVSDHGMGPISKDKVVYINQYVQKSWVARYHGGNPCYVIKAAEGKLEDVFQGLLKAEHIQVWKSPEVPERLNFGQNPRAEDLVVVADSGWSVAFGPGGSSYNGGTHGYDNTNSDMQAIFIASGPAFKKGISVSSIHNTDIYPLICHLFEWECPPCDGDLNRVNSLLNK